MKKTILALLGIITWVSVSSADPINIGDQLKKLPDLKQGVAWSLSDNKLNYLSTMEIARWKKFSLEAGYAGAAPETGHKAVAVLSVDLLSLKGVVDFPILDSVVFRPGLYAGYGRIQLNDGLDNGNNEFDWGVSATIISLKF